MDKKNLVGMLAWVVGIIVSLAVGSGMIDKTLTVPGVSAIGNGIIIIVAGWIVVIGAIVSLILAIFNK